jgi:hypothetical protein
MKLEHLFLICIYIALIINSMAVKERDYKMHTELQKIKEHLEIRK